MRPGGERERAKMDLETRYPDLPAKDVIGFFSKPFDLDELEKVMLNMTQAVWSTIHRFSPGLYIREIRIPAGVVAMGHFQKTVHLNIFLQGRVTMFNDQDGTTSELVAPMIFVGQPGRKCGYIHEEVVWLNIYPTEETDIEVLERTLLKKSDYSEEFFKGVDTRKHDIVINLLSEEVNQCQQ